MFCGVWACVLQVSLFSFVLLCLVRFVWFCSSVVSFIFFVLVIWFHVLVMFVILCFCVSRGFDLLVVVVVVGVAWLLRLGLFVGGVFCLIRLVWWWFLDWLRLFDMIFGFVDFVGGDWVLGTVQKLLG